jgi:membrane associated rhomboid family serine protease
MKDYFRELDSAVSRNLSPVVKWLIYLCCGVFLCEVFAQDFIVTLFGARPITTIYGLQLWQLVTYAFVHASIWHLFVNLITLFFFGPRIERRWGSETFLRFVLIVGAGAVLTHMVVTILMSSAAGRIYLYIPIIGISGVLFGIMLVYALYYPNDIVLVYGILPIKVKYLMVIVGVFTLVSSTQPGLPVAHLTHLGGLVFGYLFYRFPSVFQRIPMPRLSGRKSRSRWDDF